MSLANGKSLNVFKQLSCELNCNVQPDECNGLAATKYERSTLHLVHLTRCRAWLTHAGSNCLQLLRCTFGQRVAWGIHIFPFTEVAHIERSVEISVKTLLT